MTSSFRTSQQGFLLITVVVVLGILAAIAMMLSTSTSSDNALVENHTESITLDYLAESGMEHAQWLIAQNGVCDGYTDLPSTPFGDGTYSTAVTPTSGSPVSVTAVGTLPDGTTRDLTRYGVKVYDRSVPVSEILIPGAEGKDTFIEAESGHTGHNKGGDNEIKTSSSIDKEYRTLLQFDLSGLPPTAMVQTATLELYLQSYGSTDVVEAHRLLRDWTEDGVTWDDYDGVNSWGVPGGDYDPDVAGSFLADSIGPKTMDITDVTKAWVNGSQPNYGLILLSTPSASGSQNKYHSSDKSGAPHPKLILTYVCECGTSCAASSSTNLLFVVGQVGGAGPTSEELAHQSLVESWGYTVEIIDDGASQAEFDTAVANNDVVFMTNDITANNVGNKLVDATIGVVTSEDNLSDEFGLSEGIEWESGTNINIDNNSHYITSPFATGQLTIFSSFSSSQALARLDESIAPDLVQLGSLGSEPMLVAIESGGALYPTGIAAGRRVQLPWGGSPSLEPNDLNANGLTILQRALEWGAGIANGGDPLPIAHWKLDENTGSVAVDSEGGHDGALINGPTWATGRFDGALNFDGTNDYVDVPHDDSLSLTETMTFSAWINSSYFGSSYQTIIAKDAGGAGSNYYFGTWQQELVFGFFSGGVFREVFTTGLNLQTGTWYHLAASFDNATGQVLLYVDGAQVRDGTLGFSPTEITANITIGRSPDGERWGGLLDDIRIYERLLSAAEIAEMVVQSDGPIAHWKLDETSGNTAVDSIGGHDGTLVNGPSWVTGKLDGGLSFDGSNDYIVAASLNPMSYDDFTVSAWYKSADSSVSDDEYIFEHNDNFTYEITFGPTDDGTDDRLRFGFASGGSGTWDPHYGTSDIVDQQWHHVVGVRSSGRILLYVDGALETDDADAHAGVTITIDGDGPFIGDLPGNTEQVHGILDDVRLYDRALPASEVADLFAAGGGGSGGGGSCDGTFRDEFNAQSYTGSDGTLAWAGDWEETGESTSPTGGDIRIDDDVSDYQLKVRDDGQTVMREADLGTAGSATLSFDYRRQNLSGSGDYVAVEISYNGGSSWAELDRFAGTATDASYTSTSYPLDANQLSATTRIRFLTPGSGMSNSNIVWFDNIQIECGP